jgi:pimeloyl-ACP methyl ester carboxylesterase
MAIIKLGDIQLNVFERGRGTPVLLVHGYPLDHSMWRGQLDGLADCCRLIAPDLRGFGESSVTPGTVTMAQMADDLAGLLDAMRVSEPIVFCGLSMGGYVAWQFAFRHRARLSKLILCDTRAIADSAEAAAGRLKTAERVLVEGTGVAADALVPKLFAPGAYSKQPEIVEQTRQVILRTSAAGIAAALLGMAERPNVTDRLGEIDVPALLIGGRHDGISPPDEMRGIAGRMPKARFVEIEDAGHMAPLEQADVVNAAIREFLGSAV